MLAASTEETQYIERLQIAFLQLFEAHRPGGPRVRPDGPRSGEIPFPVSLGEGIHPHEYFLLPSIPL
jgi:hypothetical protein